MALTVRGSGKVKIVRPYQETDKFYRCFIITSKKLADGSIVNFEFAIKLVGKALELAPKLNNEDSYLKITNAKLSNKKDERFTTSSYKRTQIVVYDAEIITQEEFERTQHVPIVVEQDPFADYTDSRFVDAEAEEE